MKKKQIGILFACILAGNIIQAMSDSRMTRDVVIDIDTTLTLCCSNIEVNFMGTFSEISALGQILQTQGCAPTLIRQSDVGTTGFTITGSGAYKIAENIIFDPVSSAAAITINADNVFLDSYCFSIVQGNGTASVDGIAIAPGRKNIVITNTDIIGMTRSGLRIGAGCSNIAYSIGEISSCAQGITCLGTNLAPVDIVHITDVDLTSNFTGLSCTSVAHVFVADCLFFSQNNAGIELIQSYTNIIQNVVINSTNTVNGSVYGISLTQGGGNTITQCVIDGVSTNDTFTGNKAVGIYIGATENNDVIKDNQISNCFTTSSALPFGIEMDYSIIVTLTGAPIGNSSAGEVPQVDWLSNANYIAVAQALATEQLLAVFDNKFGAVAQQTLAFPISGVASSPDGQFVTTFVTTASTLNVYQFGGAELELVANITQPYTDLGFPVYQISWSPDGKYIASALNGITYIAKFSSTSLLLNNVTQVNLGNRVAWSPDGRYLAVASSGSNTFFIYSFDGNSLTQVATFTNANVVDSINWSPNGQFIAVASPTGVAVLNFTGSSLQLVVNFPLTVAVANWAQWSPDGQLLAVVHNSNIPDLLILKFDGNSLVRVANNSTFDDLIFIPQWSPIGATIAVPAITATFLVYPSLSFPLDHIIRNNEISNVRGPALPVGQPGVSSGRGLSASSANNLIIQNTVFDTDLNYVFVTNVFEQFVANATTQPSLLSNLSFPPL